MCLQSLNIFPWFDEAVIFCKNSSDLFWLVSRNCLLPALLQTPGSSSTFSESCIFCSAHIMLSIAFISGWVGNNNSFCHLSHPPTQHQHGTSTWEKIISQCSTCHCTVNINPSRTIFWVQFFWDNLLLLAIQFCRDRKNCLGDIFKFLLTIFSYIFFCFFKVKRWLVGDHLNIFTVHWCRLWEILICKTVVQADNV